MSPSIFNLILPSCLTLARYNGPRMHVQLHSPNMPMVYESQLDMLEASSTSPLCWPLLDHFKDAHSWEFWSSQSPSASSISPLLCQQRIRRPETYSLHELQKSNWKICSSFVSNHYFPPREIIDKYSEIPVISRRCNSEFPRRIDIAPCELAHWSL